MCSILSGARGAKRGGLDPRLSPRGQRGPEEAALEEELPVRTEEGWGPREQMTWGLCSSRTRQELQPDPTSPAGRCQPGLAATSCRRDRAHASRWQKARLIAGTAETIIKITNLTAHQARSASRVTRRGGPCRGGPLGGASPGCTPRLDRGKRVPRRKRALTWAEGTPQGTHGGERVLPAAHRPRPHRARQQQGKSHTGAGAGGWGVAVGAQPQKAAGAPTAEPPPDFLRRSRGAAGN